MVAAGEGHLHVMSVAAFIRSLATQEPLRQPRRDAEGRRQESTARHQAWRKARPAAYRAHILIKNALRSGAINRQPCAVCGAGRYVEAHHDDYREPLMVQWLCAKHHRERHRVLAEQGRDPRLTGS